MMMKNGKNALQCMSNAYIHSTGFCAVVSVLVVVVIDAGPDVDEDDVFVGEDFADDGDETVLLSTSLLLPLLL